jgi:hypothetical protein
VVSALKSSFGVSLPERSALKSKLSDILLEQLPNGKTSHIASVDAHPE